jgi:hypothetical protein
MRRERVAWVQRGEALGLPSLTKMEQRCNTMPEGNVTSHSPAWHLRSCLEVLHRTVAGRVVRSMESIGRSSSWRRARGMRSAAMGAVAISDKMSRTRTGYWSIQFEIRHQDVPYGPPQDWKSAAERCIVPVVSPYPSGPPPRVKTSPLTIRGTLKLRR